MYPKERGKNKKEQRLSVNGQTIEKLHSYLESKPGIINTFKLIGIVTRENERDAGRKRVGNDSLEEAWGTGISLSPVATGGGGGVGKGSNEFN